MPDIVVRLGVLALVSMLLCLFTWSGQRFVEARRRQALAAAAPGIFSEISDGEVQSRPLVRILAFSSANCHQCHQLQAPALKRVLEARGTDVSVVDVDAPDEPELAQRYQVLTVPTTVVLDAKGRAHAVNYGFANTVKLLEQVDEVLGSLTGH
ncbi:MAG: thioredoxin family protein [Ktedonobacteraceae bacterium]